MPITKKKTVKKSPKVAEKKYKLTIIINGGEYVADTNNVGESLQSFPLGQIKTRVVFKVESEGKTCVRIVNAFEAKRIFKNKIIQGVFIRRLILK